MTEVPDNLHYTDSHEWVQLDSNDTATIGITDHAQALLGDLVFVELPNVGQILEQGDEAGVVESVKAASDIYAPLSGEILEINEKLENAPELINQSPYHDGWLYRIHLSHPTEASDLLDPTRYTDCIEE